MSSSLVCRCVSIASATSLSDRRWREGGRIDLMITSTSVTLFRGGGGTSRICFTTRILKRHTRRALQPWSFTFKTNKIIHPHLRVWRYRSSSWLLNSLKTPLHSSRVWNGKIALEAEFVGLVLDCKTLVSIILPFLNMLHLCHRSQIPPLPAPTRTGVHAVEKASGFKKTLRHWALNMVQQHEHRRFSHVLRLRGLPAPLRFPPNPVHRSPAPLWGLQGQQKAH